MGQNDQTATLREKKIQSEVLVEKKYENFVFLLFQPATQLNNKFTSQFKQNQIFLQSQQPFNGFEHHDYCLK